MSSPLLLALSILSSSQGVYRLTVVDSSRRVRGVLSGLGLLEVLAGIKADGIKKRSGKGLESLLRQPVRLFVNEYLHKLSDEIPIRGLISYMVENKVGHVVLVDQTNILRGVVTEGCILSRIPRSSYPGRVSDIMTPKVHTVGAGQSLLDATKMMSIHKIRRLPIVDEKRVSGILTVTNLLRHIATSEYPIKAVLSREEIGGYLLDSVASAQPEKVPLPGPEAQVCDIIEQFVGPRSVALPIIDSKGDIVGIVSPRDVLLETPSLIGLDEFVKLLGT